MKAAVQVAKCLAARVVDLGPTGGGPGLRSGWTCLSLQADLSDPQWEPPTGVTSVLLTAHLWAWVRSEPRV